MKCNATWIVMKLNCYWKCLCSAWNILWMKWHVVDDLEAWMFNDWHDAWSMAKASEQIDGLEFNHHNNRARSDSRHAQNHEQMARPNGPTIFLMLFCFSHQMLLFWLFPCSRFGFHAQTIVFLMHNWISHCESTFVCCHWHLQPASCNWDVPPIVSVFFVNFFVRWIS